MTVLAGSQVGANVHGIQALAGDDMSRAVARSGEVQVAQRARGMRGIHARRACRRCCPRFAGGGRLTIRLRRWPQDAGRANRRDGPPCGRDHLTALPQAPAPFTRSGCLPAAIDLVAVDFVTPDSGPVRSPAALSAGQ
jgi:hypothetical protein